MNIIKINFNIKWFYNQGHFGGGWGLNPGPCIFYALSLSTELSSRGHSQGLK